MASARARGFQLPTSCGHGVLIESSVYKCIYTERSSPIIVFSIKSLVPSEIAGETFNFSMNAWFELAERRGAEPERHSNLMLRHKIA